MKRGIWTVWLLLLGSSVFGQNVITFDEFMEGVENRTAQEELNLMLEGVEDEEDEAVAELAPMIHGDTEQCWTEAGMQEGESPIQALEQEQQEAYWECADGIGSGLVFFMEVFNEMEPEDMESAGSLEELMDLVVEALASYEEEEEDEESLEVDFELYGEMREAGYSPVGALGLQI